MPPIQQMLGAMAKQSAELRKTALDDLDLKIVALLREDGRLSASEVAGRIGNIAERTVRNRIASLLQHKHIVISAIPDPTMIGQDVQADLLIETVPGQTDAIARQMVEYDQVGYLCAMSGQYNLGASVMAECNASLHEFIETEVSTIPGIQRINTMMVMRFYKVFNTRTSTATDGNH
jgi:Lrp/AsnC family transcriptional regulator for asnA, asnC and gidA